MSDLLLLERMLTREDGREDRDAVVWSGGSITHRELHHASLRIASHLAELGIGPGHRVAICLPKSPASVEAICGVLLSGAAYVPLDIFSPSSRLGKILGDAEPTLVITTTPLLEKFESTWNCFAIADTGSAAFDSLMDNGSLNELRIVSPDSPACLLYTSGSTGVPKGVTLSHRNVSSFVRWAIGKFGLTGEDRFASHAPFHFDLSTLDLFAPLHTGGSVYLLDEKTIRFPAAVSRALDEEGVTILYAVPSALRSLLETGSLGTREFRSLRRVFFAGEVFPIPPLRRLMQVLPHAKFANLYGPTETNVCTFHELENAPDEDALEIPVGRACPHFEVSLIDENGVESDEGEICVTGPGVMLGYWGDPEMTERARWQGRKETFLTGDYGRRTRDGQILFRGRRDQQIKIRGHRFDLVEIESELARFPDLECCAAEFVEDAIVAFAVARKNTEVSAEALQEFCAERLPVWAVPSHVKFLPELPKTSTGKTDRTALQKLAAAARPPEF